MAATDARPIPIKNTAFRVTFAIYDQEGDLVPGATGLDSEVSLDAGTFADCSNEATEIATNSGIYYLDLTAAEMNADTVAVIVKTTSVNAKTTALALYPAENTDIPVNVTAISGDTVAADNAESFFDGTGYAGTNNVIPSVTTVTGNVNGSVGSVSGAVGSVTGSVGGSVASVTAPVTVGTNNDKTGYALSGAGVTAVQSGLATGTDVTAVGNDVLAVAGDVASVLANTDVATSTRLASASYTAPDNTGIDAIEAALAARLDVAVSTRLASASYTTPPTTADIATAVWANATRTLTAISSTLRDQIADNIIRRSYANAAASADGDAKTGRSILGMIARLTNRSAISGATLTVYESDDTTALFTQTLTTDATAEPVVDANTV